MPQSYLPYIAICISALSALFTGLNIYLNWRNQDRYGLKKIVFDKKLKAVLDLHESVTNTRILIYSANYSNEYSARGLKACLKRDKVDLSDKILFIDPQLIHDMFDDVYKKAQHPLIDKRISDSAEFINGPFKKHKITLDVAAKHVVASKADVKEGFSQAFVYDKPTNIHDFVSLMDGIQIEIEKWITANTSLKKVFRKD